ncbi:hypothetical protein ERO13_D13G071750v2 [Gossypium hirsutum]|uniref:Uncharacterized protein n=3 Tax=Gossypium TaxID=3633 RepID=A0A5J5NIJ2_GOSBA|nr:hypothetical protein ES319_D13G079900v1 [Gossypium barbadense]KAG4110843.1 hypothetical protein ERO13_D13G071750v2 [Gossypium hirsutum]TYG36712.1 hypothetical protein ES288_D13G085100v1 [Gossypium darwinii]TYI46100.1 hypothetical protein E1A91_D13G082900v1 [Gossypium mustelinum]
MEGLQNLVCSFSKDAKSGSLFSCRKSSTVLAAATVRRSELCRLCFIAEIIVNYSFKRRVRQWTSKVLKRLKDDWCNVINPFKSSKVSY